MNRIHPRKFGLAVGLTGVLLYLGCMLLMLLAGRSGTVQFFNSLLHGLDVTSIVRMHVPLWESVLGIVETFVLGWFSGACAAWIYNSILAKSKEV